MPGPTTANVVNNAPSIAGTANQLAITYSGTSATVSLSPTVVNSNQPLFFAYLNATVTNVTGDGTVYTIVYNSTTVNQDSSYNTATGIFTAPVTGNYLFNTCNIAAGSSSGTNSTLIQLVTTSASYNLVYYSAYGANLIAPMSSSVIVPMTSGNTAKIQLTGSGSTKTMFIEGASVQYDTFFSGMLLPA
jgi:C1q domain